jgi:hypothetical protein
MRSTTLIVVVDSSSLRGDLHLAAKMTHTRRLLRRVNEFRYLEQCRRHVVNEVCGSE